MKISSLFRELSFGELSNLSISSSGSGEILQAKWPQLIHYTNDGLMALHTRFVLSEKELVIELDEGITEYVLSSKHSETIGTDDDLYIKDTVEAPFKDDAILILGVWDTTGKRSLNDSDDPTSLFTPKPLTLQVPEPIAGRPMSVIYQASHPKLDDVVPDEDPETLLEQEIELPQYLHGALRQWVAYKVFSHMNGQENIMKGQEYLAAYDGICAGVEQRDLANQTHHTSFSKLHQRGFK